MVSRGQDSQGHTLDFRCSGFSASCWGQVLNPHNFHPLTPLNLRLTTGSERENCADSRPDPTKAPPHLDRDVLSGSKSMWNRETNNKPNTVPGPTAYTPEPAPQQFAPVESAPVVPAAPVKAKGSTLVIKGELAGSEDLAIEGKVEGKISLPEHVLTIGLGAQVAAEVIARVVILHGAVTGNITAYERVEV